MFIHWRGDWMFSDLLLLSPLTFAMPVLGLEEGQLSPVYMAVGGYLQVSWTTSTRKPTVGVKHVHKCLGTIAVSLYCCCCCNPSVGQSERVPLMYICRICSWGDHKSSIRKKCEHGFSQVMVLVVMVLFSFRSSNLVDGDMDLLCGNEQEGLWVILYPMSLLWIKD